MEESREVPGPMEKILFFIIKTQYGITIVSASIDAIDVIEHFLMVVFVREYRKQISLGNGDMRARVGGGLLSKG